MFILRNGKRTLLTKIILPPLWSVEHFCPADQISQTEAISTTQLSECIKLNLPAILRLLSSAVRPTCEWEQTIWAWTALTEQQCHWGTSGKSRIPIITCATLDWSNQSYLKKIWKTNTDYQEYQTFTKEMALLYIHTDSWLINDLCFQRLRWHLDSLTSKYD